MRQQHLGKAPCLHHHQPTAALLVCWPSIVCPLPSCHLLINQFRTMEELQPHAVPGHQPAARAAGGCVRHRCHQNLVRLCQRRGGLQPAGPGPADQAVLDSEPWRCHQRRTKRGGHAGFYHHPQLPVSTGVHLHCCCLRLHCYCRRPAAELAAAMPCLWQLLL